MAPSPRIPGPLLLPAIRFQPAKIRLTTSNKSELWVRRSFRLAAAPGGTSARGQLDR